MLDFNEVSHELTTYETALHLVESGISVIPLKPRDKRPAIPSWREYQSRLPDNSEIVRWFYDTDCNLGIVTGAISGLTVADFDTPESVEIAEQYGLPRTPTVKTGKGYHAYCRFKDGSRNFQKRDDLPGIDLRSEGGYVVAPPSIHSNGSQYQWLDGMSITDLPLADLPEWLLARKPEQKTTAKDVVSGTMEGSRNDSLAKVAGSVIASGMGFDEVLRYCTAWNLQNMPPLGMDELERTVRSIWSVHNRNHPPAELTQISPYQAAQLTSDVKNLDVKLEYVVEGLIPEGFITLFYAPGGLGKSTLISQVVQAIVDGTDFYGLKTKQCPVFYLDYENPDSTLVTRLRKVGGNNPYHIWRSNSDPPPPQIDDTARRNELLQIEPGTVLVVDTLKASNDAEENSPKEMKPLFDFLKLVRNRGITVILLHHTNKGPDGQYRGTTVIVDQSDHCISLAKVKAAGSDIEASDDMDDGCVYRFGVKGKTRAKPFRMFLEFDRDNELFKSVADPDTDNIAEIETAIAGIWANNTEANQTAIIKALTKEVGRMMSESRIRNLLKKRDGIEWTTSKGHNNSTIYTLSTLPRSVGLGTYIGTPKPPNQNRLEYHQPNTASDGPLQSTSPTGFDGFLVQPEKPEKPLMPEWARGGSL